MCLRFEINENNTLWMSLKLPAVSLVFTANAKTDTVCVCVHVHKTHLHSGVCSHQVLNSFSCFPFSN